jgi:hypothetical protein
MEPHVIPRRSRSLESNGSTASLTSVLDHDSYESPDISEDEWEREELRKNVENEEKTIEQDRRNRSSYQGSAAAKNRVTTKSRTAAKSQDRGKVQRKNRITAHQKDR